MRNRPQSHRHAVLHAALLPCSARHVKQGRSVVEPSRLRFDFTHSPPWMRMTSPSRAPSRIADFAQQEVTHQCPGPPTRPSPPAPWRCSGDKYGDKVPRGLEYADFSRNSGGARHVSRTGRGISSSKCVYVRSISAGFAALEAITGEGACETLSGSAKRTDSRSERHPRTVIRTGGAS